MRVPSGGKPKIRPYYRARDRFGGYIHGEALWQVAIAGPGPITMAGTNTARLWRFVGLAIYSGEKMLIREATLSDWDDIWPVFEEVVSAGDTYAYPGDTDKQAAEIIWLSRPRKTFVVEEEGKVYGTYYLKTNQDGPGSHVCNCGYMVSSAARGKGLATTMCEHSQDMARNFGYKAMQFNFVASSNEGAVRLWNKLGFDTVGRLPKAFKHPAHGLVDALVMYKWLD